MYEFTLLQKKIEKKFEKKYFEIKKIEKVFEKKIAWKKIFLEEKKISSTYFIVHQWIWSFAQESRKLSGTLWAVTAPQKINRQTNHVLYV